MSHSKQLTVTEDGEGGREWQDGQGAGTEVWPTNNSVLQSGYILWGKCSWILSTDTKVTAGKQNKPLLPQAPTPMAGTSSWSHGNGAAVEVPKLG